MSILIKNMTLPKNCAECRLCDTCECLRDFRTYEEVLDAVEDGDLTRDQNCPLVEIPATHGDLVDRDKLMADVMDSDLDHLQRDDWKEVIQIVGDAPTVIEGEG